MSKEEAPFSGEYVPLGKSLPWLLPIPISSTAGFGGPAQVTG
jgi:hypothetical protein